MAQPHIRKFDDVEPVARGGGIETRPLTGKETGAQGISTGVTSFPPGAAVELHTHNVEEAVTLLEGEARVEIEGREPVSLRPYDTTYVPAGVAHRFVNAGTGRMRILWCYGGTEVTRTFLASGETVGHLSPGDRIG
ncbi:MAG TPA: cupin domain-containing protein [Dehalococcoidia bacterium]|nr:cupin domain-containing protein [Dehalococcoidia bacterium]